MPPETGKTDAVSKDPNPFLNAWTGRKKSWFWALVPALMTFLFYLPVTRHDFVIWDDQVFIFDNPHIRAIGLTFFQWIWSTSQTGNWIPLTWISLALDYQIAGFHPWVYHIHNLFLHALNTTLVFFLSFRVLESAQKQIHDNDPGLRSGFPLVPAAFLSALLFGLHPLHVESVAWAAERRDVLCAFFYLGSLLLYVDYASQVPVKKWKFHACLGLFLLALMSKPMSVTLPLVLLLLDAWPLGRLKGAFSKMLFEKTLFILASLAVSGVTAFAQYQAGAFITPGLIPLDYRIMNAFHSLGFYLWKILLPLNLAPFYPMDPNLETYTLTHLASALAVAAISLVCVIYWRRKPYLAAAWVFYLATLAPVLGFPQVGLQAAADRYTYLPTLGIFLLVSSFLSTKLSKKPALLAGLCALMVLGLGSGTVRQLSIWKNSVALWEEVDRLFPEGSQVPHANLARAYELAGRHADALREYDLALALPPTSAHIHEEKGTVLLSMNRPDEAIEELNQAVNLYQDAAPSDLYHHLWYAYELKGLHEKALAAIQEVVKIRPDFSDGFRDLGVTYWNLKRLKDSEEAFKNAYSLNPFSPEYLDNLGSLYIKNRNLPEATAWYKKGIMLMPKEALFYGKLGDIDMLQGKYKEAAQAYQTAESLQPQNPDYFKKWKLAQKKSGKKE